MIRKLERPVDRTAETSQSDAVFVRRLWTVSFVATHEAGHSLRHSPVSLG